MTNLQSVFPETVAEAAEMLHGNMSLNDELMLANMNEEDLIDVHFALAYHIRNEFGLWKGNESLLESCRSIAGNNELHVDDASMIIVKKLWEKVKEENILQY